MADGMKFDNEKPMWDLLNLGWLEGAVKVLTFGAKKYAPNNFKNVAPHKYKAALMRHLMAIDMGEETDPESNLSHLDHVLTNLLFMKWYQLECEKKGIKPDWNQKETCNNVRSEEASEELAEYRGSSTEDEENSYWVPVRGC